jgi:predicted acetyltransferase
MCEKWLDTHYTIPCTTYWLMKEEIVVWTLNLRHSLNDFLLKEWWHIWYSIHPDYIWKGYGTEMLTLWLEKAKGKWITKVLVTCDDDNIASEKIILANGWVYENTIEWTKRFWIDNN